MIAWALGLAAGALHVVSGPDHLAAVAPSAVQSRGGGWAVGLRWGLGHALGVGLVGLAALALERALPLEALSSWSERLVGVALVGVGLLGLMRALRGRVTAPHAHEPTAFGALHGLAGSSHLVGVLPALGLRDGLEIAQYLLGFGLGSIAAMSLYAVSLGRLHAPPQTLSLAASSAAIVVGVLWLL